MKKNKSDTLTPMMIQYSEIKSRNPGHILFYRLGDFYEMFFDDAKTASKVLNITLTTRGKHLGTEIPLAGFPHHQLENYLSKMIKAGYKVAVCDQTENPKHAKGIVKRDVTEVVSAGTALSEDIIGAGKNNYIIAVCSDGKKIFGLAAADIISGEFTAFDAPDASGLTEMILRFDPSEIISHEGISPKLIPGNISVSYLEQHRFFYGSGPQTLKEYFGISSFSSLGFSGGETSLSCAGVLIEYIRDNLRSGMPSLEKLKKYSDGSICTIDFRTRRNLEILEPASAGGNRDATLFAVMDHTNTPMGSRLLKKWLTAPLRDGKEICRRLNITEDLVKNDVLKKKILKELSCVGDIERLSAKLSSNRIRPDELVRMKNSLKIIPKLKELLSVSKCPETAGISQMFSDPSECVSLIEFSISESQNLSMKEKRFIKRGYSKELDELYDITEHGKEKLIDLSDRIKKQLGIPGIRIGYNRVFGYYFETSKKYSEMIPDDFIRKQTLVNAERFINSELKEFEEKILNADEKIEETVGDLFEKLKEELRGHTGMIKANAPVIASLDCLCSYAEAACIGNYTRPEFSDKKELVIKNGRHPVVEKHLGTGEDYIPNDLTVSEDKNILIITGPNMSGKSTFLRQAALIVLLAQAGSFVPAESARIGMTDKIFTRVGASDNLSGGESTFLVEMNETANILNNATPDSLIIFDEVGRGTATFDGLSLAWSIVEYIHNTPAVSSRTLFATHFHELTEIDRICPRVRNFHAGVREHKDEIIFMRKIIEGAADHSYGIYVAKLAGLPESVLKRAAVILGNLEENELTPDSKPVIAKEKNKGEIFRQPDLFSFENDFLREMINNIDVDNITPVEALVKLHELKRSLII